MVDINIHINSGKPEPAKERTIFAFGLVRFNAAQGGNKNQVDNEVRVLGLMVVKDTTEDQPAEDTIAA